MTIGAALDVWLEDKRQAGIKPASIQTVDKRLRPFLPRESTLGDITPQRAAKLYLDETKREGRFGVLRACTHQKTLIFAKGFFSWAVERGYLKENPFIKVKPVGKASAGKPQLREDEARKLYELALVLAQDGDWRALALLVQLVMGLRSSEVLGLRARDLDANGSVLVIEGTKSKNAWRRLKIASEPLRRLLITRCLGLAPDALIFATARGGRMLTPMLYKAMHRLCYLAQIPKVCPHSLRGLHSSLAVAHGESSRAVAQALGHGNDAITRKHYITPEALDNARLDRVASTLSGPKSADLEGLSSALGGLSPEQLSALLASVEKRRKPF
jgi:integrase